MSLIRNSLFDTLAPSAFNTLRPSRLDPFGALDTIFPRSLMSLDRDWNRDVFLPSIDLIDEGMKWTRIYDYYD